MLPHPLGMQSASPTPSGRSHELVAPKLAESGTPCERSLRDPHGLRVGSVLADVHPRERTRPDAAAHSRIAASRSSSAANRIKAQHRDVGTAVVRASRRTHRHTVSRARGKRRILEPALARTGRSRRPSSRRGACPDPKCRAPAGCSEGHTPRIRLLPSRTSR